MNTKIKKQLYDIIFEADTESGRLFDIVLLIVILLSIFVVILESVPTIEIKFGHWLTIAEWFITIIFTIEYLLRILVVKKPLTYIFSFYGIIDFLAVIPTYIVLFITGAHGLLVIRALRLLRIFRILKISRYTTEGQVIIESLKASKAKISIFLFAVLTIVIIIGTIMYLVEGEVSGFTSIPKGIYWAIVTLTTVGYGDIAPVTNLGQCIASFVMVLGYAIIAVPTGIVTAEFTRTKQKKITTQCCPNCLKEDHERDAIYCRFCGAILNE
jgi:voltage-gated potassium channel